MKIMHITFRDARGGAAIATKRLHEGLRQAGVDSFMRVAEKVTSDPLIERAQYSRHAPARLHRAWQRWCTAHEMGEYQDALRRMPILFSNDRAPGGASFWKHLPAEGIINLHWFAGVTEVPTDEANRNLPLVLTLHDYNPFTGGCHNPLGCHRFEAACGQCPLLGNRKEKDLSRIIHKRKQRRFEARSAATTLIVAPSEAVASDARRSGLLRRFDVTTIPHGFNTETFQPRDKSFARELFGLPPDKIVLLFAAATVNDPLKGIDILEAALAQLGLENVIVVSIGSCAPDLRVPFSHHALGEIKDERLLSFAYSTADIFVTPTKAESFGLVAAEAMACGIPIVASDVGALPELLNASGAGLVVASGNAHEFRTAIQTLVKDASLRTRMGTAGRHYAVEHLSLDLQVSRYCSLYEALLEARSQ